MPEKYYLEETAMSFSYRKGPAGKVGGVLGTQTIGGIDFFLNVKIWTNHECKFDHNQPVSVMPWFNSGAGVRIVSGGQPLPVQWGHETRKGCLDTYGNKNSWDTATAEVSWIVEDTIPIPFYTPATGFISLPNPFSGQTTIRLVLKVFPNGQKKLSTWKEAYVDGVLQFSHA